MEPGCDDGEKTWFADQSYTYTIHTVVVVVV